MNYKFVENAKLLFLVKEANVGIQIQADSISISTRINNLKNQTFLPMINNLHFELNKRLSV